VRVSVVVASFSGEEALRSCLDSLESQHGDAEVIVSAALEPATMERLRQRYTWAQLQPAPPAATVFQLRTLGLDRAHAAVAVLLEDHCVVPAGWLGALVSSVVVAMEGDGGLAGGAVESGLPSSLAGFALYLVEYGALMPPLPDARAILAVNAAYDRSALEACRPVWADGFHESEVHDALRAAGHVPRLAAEATVRSHLRMPLARALAHLFRGGARFGAYRQRRWSTAERVLRILAAPLVPPVLVARMLGRLLRRRPRALARFVLALPYVLCLVTAWSAGELTGHVRPRHRGAS
jgi:hypothetical protein